MIDSRYQFFSCYNDDDDTMLFTQLLGAVSSGRSSGRGHGVQIFKSSISDEKLSGSEIIDPNNNTNHFSCPSTFPELEETLFVNDNFYHNYWPFNFRHAK
ncbi:hypothetical protein LOAG_04681 [Loa loa]|uniref:Uncharacterized protein n=1 Tax=Loa loa TaxID=7209 RepID=A0A1S0U3H7_LOALO|nr:hypothetical protein LOAG_04681 [Loa loa]EFO23805.1 hypothetical protein LOAG_04681 [Loa loa]